MEIGVATTRALLALALTTALSSAAALAAGKPPKGIYVGHSCAKLAGEHAQIAQAIAVLTQDRNSGKVAAGFAEMLIGVPLTPFVGGDDDAKIGELNARLALLDAVMEQRNCPPIAPP